MLSPKARPFYHRLAIPLVAASIPTVASAQTKTHITSTALARSIYGTSDLAPTMPMPLVAPVFLQTDQIDSSITVVNSIISAVQGTIVLRDQTGNVIGQQVMTFPAHSSTPVPMRAVLTAVGSQAHSGSVTLTQDQAIKGPALVAQLSMTMHTGSQAAFLEEEFGMPTPHGSTVLEGVASQTRNLPLIAVTSVSDASQTISASCVGENAKPSTIELPAYGTAIVQACSWQVSTDGSLNLGSSLLNGKATSDSDHAVYLKTDSVPGAFYAFGFALNGGLDQPQLQPLDFYDPGALASSSNVYVGVPVGANSIIPAILSAPVLTLANFSNQPRLTTVTFSDSSSGSPKVQPVASLTLPALSTQTVNLTQAAGSGILNTFTITSNGNPGDVQAHLFTRVGSSMQRTELLAKDARDDHNGGDHPWSIANGDASTLLLYNSTSQSQQFQVRISGSGSSWLQLFRLAPAETRAVSINDIIAKGTPDHKGRTLPSTITVGEVQWSTDFGATGLGRLLVTNTKSALARSFSCPYYYNLCSGSFGAYNFENVLLDGGDIDLSEISVGFCTTYNPSSCTGATTGETESYTTNWENANSNVIKVVGSTNTYIALTGISAGNFSIYGSAEAGSCQTSPPMSGGGTVQTPTSFILSDHTKVATPSICTSNKSIGYFEDLSNYVADQSGNRISMSGITPLESANSFGGGYATPSSTRTDGSFDDTPFGACYETTGSFCEASSNDPITHKASSNGNTYNIGTTYTTRECTLGLKLTISGNPSSTSQGFTDGTVY